MMKILITNAYSSQNKGDAGIIIGMIDDLSRRKTFKKAEINISTTDYPSDSKSYSHPVVPSFHSLKNTFSRNPYLQFLSFLIIIFPLSLIWVFFYRYFNKDIRILNNVRQLLRVYGNSDLIIAAGGGYLYTTSKAFGNVVIFITIYCFYFGVLMGKPVYIYSQSIGPFASRFQAWFVKMALRKVRLIEAREQFSYSLVQSWKIHTPLHRTIDAAFLLSCEDSFIISEVSMNKLRVGITVRKWFRNQNEQQQYERTMGEFINWLISEMDVFVFFVPQVTFKEGKDDDRTAARDIYSYIKPKNFVRLIEEELSPQQIKGLCGKMDLFVGTRMHSNIYALSMNVPTMAIAYQPKTKGIMEQLELESFLLPITDLNLHNLKKKFRLLIERQDEIKDCLVKKIPEFRKRAAQSGQIIEEDFTRFS